MSVEEVRVSLNPSVRMGWARTLFNLDNEAVNLKGRLVNLVSRKESFNMIIMGPPGSGKNTFFETCVAELKSENPEFYSQRKIVRLNGLLCGKSLRASIIEIFSQLKMEEVSEAKYNSFDDKLDSIMEALRTKLTESGTGKKSRIHIFVLDNLEYFCDGTQTLLYNLFDSCASGQGCLGVVGITKRVDITEMFEKRVKSRFSHRIINLTGGRSFDDYLTMATKLMYLENSHSWNQEIIQMIKSHPVQQALKMLYDTDKNIGWLSLFLYEAAVLSKDVKEIQENITKTWNKYNTSSKIQQCLDLSPMDLMLILTIRLVHPEPFQFDTLWQQISKLAAQFRHERIDLKNSFQNLEALELIVPIRTRGKKGNKMDCFFYRSNMSYGDLSQALQCYPNLPTSYQEYLHASSVTTFPQQL